MRRTARAFSLMAVLLALAARAHAVAPEDVKRADLLFHEGQRLLKAGRVDEACAAFAESHHLDPAVGTLLNLADCHAQARRLATAHAEFLEAARLAAASGQREREVFAKEQAAQSEPLLSFVEVRLAKGALIDEISIDLQPIDKAAVSAPIALDPGPHTFRFAAAGRVARVLSVEVVNGPSSQVVEVAPLESIARSPSDLPEKPKTDSKSRQRLASVVLAGAGAVAVGVGAFFGLRAMSKKGDGDSHCAGRFCDPEGLTLHDDAHFAATVSTVAFVLGAAAIGAGVYLYLTRPAPTKGVARLRVAPAFGGLRFEGAW